MTEITQTIEQAFPLAPPRSSINGGPAAFATAAMTLVALYLAGTIGWRQAALFGVGVAAGVVLYHAAFGFTSAWRVFIADARGAGLRAQMLMLALTCAVFFPLLGQGEIFGQTLRGSVSPIGVSVIVGAFLFGVGMQLGGGCASGTLYTAGGGNTRMLVTLAAFIAGSVVGLRHVPWWTAQPAFKPASLVTLFGPVRALLVSFAIFGAIAAVTLIVERRHHGDGSIAPSSRKRRAGRLAGGRAYAGGPAPASFGEVAPKPHASAAREGGRWPLAAGAIGLAIVNIATLVLAGRPWGVTSAFALWGSKALDAAGVNVAAWPYWSTPARLAELRSPVTADVTSMMDVGIMLGALVAAALAGRFAPAWRVPGRSLAAAVVGGLLLGYGARIAYGCNIGAFFSGVASGSLHGWLWFLSAFAGSIAGTRLRPLFGLRVERS